MAPKFKHQTLDKQKLTGKKYYGKRCVSVEKWYIGSCGEVFWYISGVLKWRQWVKAVGEMEWNICHSDYEIFL